MRYDRDKLRGIMGLRHECTACGSWVDAPENEDGECHNCVAERHAEEQLAALRERVFAAEVEAKSARCAATREECNRIHFAAQVEHMRACLSRIIGVVAMKRDPALFAEVMGCMSQDDLESMQQSPQSHGERWRRRVIERAADTALQLLNRNGFPMDRDLLQVAIATADNLDNVQPILAAIDTLIMDRAIKCIGDEITIGECWSETIASRGYKTAAYTCQELDIAISQAGKKIDSARAAVTPQNPEGQGPKVPCAD